MLLSGVYRSAVAQVFAHDVALIGLDHFNPVHDRFVTALRSLPERGQLDAPTAVFT